MTAADRELANRDVIVAELAVLRAYVRGDDPAEARERLESRRAALGGRSTLDEVAQGFGLTEFERAVLLLAAAPEFVAATARELVDRTGQARLTFGMAMAVLPGAHWSAVPPPAPLRRWELVHLLDPTTVTNSPLAVDERVLHHLAGVGHTDVGLAAISRLVQSPDRLPPSLMQLAAEVAAGWDRGEAVLLHGPQPGNVRSVAAAAASQAGLTLREIGSADLPAAPLELDATLRRMERETVLMGCAWAIDATDEVNPGGTLVRALGSVDAPFVVLSAGFEELTLPDAVSIAIPRLPVAERREAIAAALRGSGTTAAQTDINTAAGVFDLAVPSIELAARDVSAGAGLWEACRARQRKGIGALATVRRPQASWEQLILPEPQLEQLHALVAAVRHRATVLDEWGFGARMSRGLGTAALLTGPSGTGKTLAAEVIAHDLDLDLVQVDLSQVVNKYIGETEKQLRRLFDAAEDGGVVLLFDEADTLFGKRSEVHDSHDRYANLEVGYLLQRIESFSGLAILTTNARTALDQAFTRRLSMIISFPYPDQAAREAMWAQIFPPEAPLRGILPSELAVADLPGGGIASSALQASYLAAADGKVIRSEHLHTATRWELAKSGRAAPAPARRP